MDDFESLKALREKTDKEITNSTLMDKLSWVYISSSSLGYAIKRIEGDFVDLFLLLVFKYVYEVNN